MYALVCIRLSIGKGRHKSQSDAIPCFSRNHDQIESAKMAIVHLIKPGPDKKVELECLGQSQGDGKTYVLIVDNNDPADWVVYVKEILQSDEVLDFRHHYSGTWTHLYFKSVVCKL